MRASVGWLAAVSKGARSTRVKKPAVSLEHVSCVIIVSVDRIITTGQFIQRQRVLSFWREIVRTLKSGFVSFTVVSVSDFWN